MTPTSELNKALNRVKLAGAICSLASLAGIAALLVLTFTFTEGWYGAWGGEAGEAYQRGMPFPPLYAFLYSLITILAEKAGVDQFAALRLLGVLMGALTATALYRISRDLEASRFSAIIASCGGLSLAYSMEGFVIYDYTPFIMLLISWSLVALLDAADLQGTGEKHRPAAEITTGCLAALCAVSMAISKQNYAAYTLIYTAIYARSASSGARFAYFFIGSFATTGYVAWQIGSTGLHGLITIYTDSSYKGGTGLIIQGVARSIIDSLKAINYDELLMTGFKAAIAIAIAGWIIGIKKNGPGYNTGAKIIGRSYNSNPASAILVSGVIAAIAIISEKAEPQVPVLRISGVTLLLISILIANALEKKGERLVSRRIYTLAVPLACVVFLNAMSGSTGALDSYIPLTLCSALVLKIAEDLMNRSDLSKPGGVWFRREYALIASGLAFVGLAAVPLAAFRDVLNKGYQWWGISEKASVRRPEDILKQTHLDGPLLLYPGRSAMSPSQAEFTDRLVEFVNAPGNEDLMKEGNMLAFPNIPYFYTATGIKPFAQTPVPWIDVLPIRSSERLLKEWTRKKPDLIVYALLPMQAYSEQGKAFTQPGRKESAFLRLNLEILKLTMSGYYQIIGGYSADTYGVFTLAKSSWVAHVHDRGKRSASSAEDAQIDTSRMLYIQASVLEAIARKDEPDASSMLSTAIRFRESRETAQDLECKYAKEVFRVSEREFVNDAHRTTARAEDEWTSRILANEMRDEGVLSILEFARLLGNGYLANLPDSCNVS